jgi:hypothetical protein
MLSKTFGIGAGLPSDCWAKRERQYNQVESQRLDLARIVLSPTR